MNTGDFNSYLDATKILCKSLKTKEIYISAEGLVTLVAGLLENYIKHMKSWVKIKCGLI